MFASRLTNLFKASLSCRVKCNKTIYFRTLSYFSEHDPKNHGFEKFKRKPKESKTYEENKEKINISRDFDHQLNTKNQEKQEIKANKTQENNENLTESSGFDKFKRKQSEKTKKTPEGQDINKQESEVSRENQEINVNSAKQSQENPEIPKENPEIPKENPGIPRENQETPKENQETPKENQKNNENLSQGMKEEENQQQFSHNEEKKNDEKDQKGSKSFSSKHSKDEKKRKDEKKASNRGTFYYEFNKKKQKIKDEKPKENGESPEPKEKISLKGLLFMAFIGTAVLGVTSDFLINKKTITYFDFTKNYLEQGRVLNISIKRSQRTGKMETIATVNLKNGENKKLFIHNLDYFLNDLENLLNKMDEKHMIPIEFIYDPPHKESGLLKIFILGLSLYIMYTIFKNTRSVGKFYQGNSDMFGMGNSNVKIFGIDNNVKVRFKDVAGLNEAKVEISEFVDFLKQPTKFSEIGAKLPKGALLTGPPGTGKTMLAKACAGEAGVPFFYISGSDFVELFVGVGASRVRDLFKKAKAKSPSIIFIDEIDAVGRKRDSGPGRSNDERDNTLNQLLVEMDGFGTDSQVVVLAATNRKELLDPALVRPGRFDRQIEVSLPDIEGRYSIFLVHLTPLKLNTEKTKEEYAQRLATLTPGFSGADIANLCNEAAILAARNSKKFVDSLDFEIAAERILAGLEKKKFLSEEERKTVATHESGHAVVSWFLEGGNPLLKLTIIPRSKGSLGFAQYLPNESTLQTKEELIDQICCVLGGRCSEEFFFNKITTGAYDDLEKAYQLANAIVTKFGMSEKIGYIGFVEEEYKKNYSDYTQDIIDKEIAQIINLCTEKTRKTIAHYKEEILKLRDNLLEKETLDLNAIIDILGERPFPPKSNYRAYLKTKREMSPEVKPA